MEKIDMEEKTIGKNIIAKGTLKMAIGSLAITILTYIITISILWAIQFDPEAIWILENFQALNVSLLLYIVILPCLALIAIEFLYWTYFVKNFSYALTESHILLKHGIWTKKKATIPYSRVQNISIVNGVFDRLFKLYTVMIETAGAAGVGKAAQGVGKPEGYMPGLKDPFIFEKQLKQMLDKYNVLPSGLEDKVFKPQELAFDNFISYILTKIRPDDDLLSNNIKSLREGKKMSLVELAEKVGVKERTIELLEMGKYTPSLSLAYKIAKELGCKMEDLFKF